MNHYDHWCRLVDTHNKLVESIRRCHWDAVNKAQQGDKDGCEAAQSCWIEGMIQLIDIIEQLRNETKDRSHNFQVVMTGKIAYTTQFTCKSIFGG